MTTTMITTELINKAIRADRPTLDGFGPTDLPEAARYRLARLAARGSFDSKFDWETETPALISLHVEPTETFTARPEACDPWSYLVFFDGSLYFANNAQDEVWADARDFALERIINGYEGPLDSMDAGLLKHLGGYLAEAVEERGTR